MDNQTSIIDIASKVLMEFASTLSNIIVASAVLLFGWIISKIIAKAIHKVLAGIGVDKMAGRVNDIDFIKKSKLSLTPSQLIPKIIYYILLLIFAMIAAEVLQMPIVSTMVADLIAFIPNLIVALILFLIGIILADFMKSLVLTACISLGIPSGRVIANFVFYLVFLTLTITALDQASIQTSLISTNLTILVAGIVGAFSIGYGLASKDTMANYLASFYTKNKVKVGDIIKVNDTQGQIIAIDGASLTLQTENSLVVIPLKKLASDNLEILNN